MSLKADLQELIIAFDTRATSPPAWLTQNFERLKDVVLRSTQKYKPKGSPAKDVNVEYALWHPTPAHRADFVRAFALGGNNAAGAAWSDDVIGVQYLTFLRPIPWLDQSKTQVRDAVQIEVCEEVGDSQEALLKAAEAGKSHVLDQWLSEPEHAMYQQARTDGALVVELDAAQPCKLTTDAPTRPKTYKACGNKADEVGSLTQPITGWPLRSRAVIDPNTSHITVQAHGTTTTAPIAVGCRSESTRAIRLRSTRSRSLPIR